MEENKIVTMTRSIRADEATLERFKKISEQFDNQGKALQALIDAYELDAARSQIPGSADMLDNLQSHLTGIQNAFVFALELKQNAETAAKEAVAKTIENKEKTIAENYAKIESQKAEIEALRSEAKKTEEQLAEVLKTSQNASEALAAIKSSLADKTALLESKNAEIERLTSEAATVPELRKEVEDLRTEISAIQKTKESADRNFESAKKEFEKALQDAKKEHEKELSFAKREAAIEAKEAAALQLSDKLAAKDEEIARLKLEIMQLRLSTPSDVSDVEQTELEI